MYQFHSPQTRVLVYADKAFSRKMRLKFSLRAKTADGYLRYAKSEIVGVIDSTATENYVSDVIGIRNDIPIFPTIASFLEKTNIKPDALLIGVAPAGGDIEKIMFQDICYAIEQGMHIISGMHFELGKNEHLQQLAKIYQKELWDVRIPPQTLPVASAKAYFIKKPIILTCAADAAIGKMTVALELEKELLKRNILGEMIATGQTGIMIKGRGISIDRVIGDFMPGAVEQLLVDCENDRPENRYLILEGQGGLFHPGYAPVTLALLHGGLPSHLILVVRPLRKHSIGSKLIKIPSIREIQEKYFASSLGIRIPKFIGIAANTAGMSEKAAQSFIAETKNETGLPVEDVIRSPDQSLAAAVEKVVLDYEMTL